MKQMESNQETSATPKNAASVYVKVDIAIFVPSSIFLVFCFATCLTRIREGSLDYFFHKRDKQADTKSIEQTNTLALWKRIQ